MDKDTLKLIFSAVAARLIERGITCYVSFFENGTTQISARFAVSSIYLSCDEVGPSVRMYTNPDKVHPTQFFDTVGEALLEFWALVEKCGKKEGAL
ncbi:MAG: hypothetical protein ACFN9G_03240 [Cardiobacterium sp.]